MTHDVDVLPVNDPLEPVDGRDPADAAAPRRLPSTIGGLLYLVVLAATGLGVGLAWAGDWRLGVTWIGGALVAAGVLRLLLRSRDAGMLAVRGRVVDFVMLAGVGTVLIVLSETIPNQPVL